jgi:hypothetical protein
VIQNKRIKNFHDKQKLKQYMTTKLALQKILKALCREDERMRNVKSQEKSRQIIRE